ncbi:MAG TPA: hemerythrin domain-containing protein, partial [Methylomirabilota bacterium]|nr:hemerythrin domain-containing protein [Methylomirabilota bacterium]
MKATDLLKKQHREVKGLFKKVEKAEDAGARRRLLGQIADALTLHTKLEEHVFYPAVQELGTRKAEKMIAEAFEEHHVVDLVVKELPEVDPGDERFHAKMTVLQEMVEHHAEEEEKEMCKLAERLGPE